MHLNEANNQTECVGLKNFIDVIFDVVIKLEYMPVVTTNKNTNNIATDLAATIAGYRALFVPGRKIYYVDVLTVIAFHELWRTHTHSIVGGDSLYVAFGNTAPNPTTTEARTTLGPNPSFLVAAISPFADPGKTKIFPPYQNQATGAIGLIPATNHGHPLTDSYLNP